MKKPRMANALSLTSAVLAVAVAAPLATANAASSTTVKCLGINSCKGHSDCKTANHECKGQNACKGQGWIAEPSASECLARGGKVTS